MPAKYEDLRGVIGFRNEDALKHAKESFKLYEQAVPEGKAKVEVLTPEEALSVCQIPVSVTMADIA